MIARRMAKAKVKRDLAVPDVECVSVARYDPAQPREVGILTIDGRLYTYVTTRQGWAMMEASSGKTHQIRGRLNLANCTCGDYLARRGRNGGDCVHMLALIVCQRAVAVPTDDGHEVEIIWNPEATGGHDTETNNG